MKKAFILISILLFQTNIMAQSLSENSFDFWIGNWDVTWKDQVGKMTTGKNVISKIANEKVIQETFSDPNSDFSGTSISVYSPQTKLWHQAWADSNGNYYNFVGEMVDGNPSFVSKKTDVDGNPIIQRMVFREITENNFIWIWEGSKDDGKSWQELWKIKYNRV